MTSPVLWPRSAIPAGSMAPTNPSTEPCTLQGVATWEVEIRKSRFIARAGSVSSPDAAMAFLQRVKDPNATHNCWAYRVGSAYRFSDDGEPSGTAGRPMLTAIERQGIDHVMVVVTRFFGGIKLGAGGLARAYGGVTATCIQRAEKRPLEELAEAIVSVPFALTGQAYGLVDRLEVSRRDERFTAEGAVFTVIGARPALDTLTTALRDLSSGTITVVRADESAQ